ncbi:hypothetical protein DBR47_11780 [Paucibacter sp. KBW04]|uniref:TraB/GumN family protein n=1 Tax=Paucibacter sp. KBW04 TaxID=2153361 RepID=UPI000F56267C|nr:TraB/GumN family protein [Paucibacter sp. KBW04]RQO59324.1 hypothetical protein DBR47_11780 [Paucibacter sp. KBW04]
MKNSFAIRFFFGAISTFFDSIGMANATEMECLPSWPVFSIKGPSKEFYLLPSSHAATVPLCEKTALAIQSFVDRQTQAIAFEANTRSADIPKEKMTHGSDSGWSFEFSNDQANQVQRFFLENNASKNTIDKFRSLKAVYIATYGLMYTNRANINKNNKNRHNIDSIVSAAIKSKGGQPLFVEKASDQVDALNSIPAALAAESAAAVLSYSNCEKCLEKYQQWHDATIHSFSQGYFGRELDPWNDLKLTGYPSAEIERIFTNSRNRNLATKTIEMSTTGTGLFVFGVNHFYGDRSILNELKLTDRIDSIECNLINDSNQITKNGCATRNN